MSHDQQEHDRDPVCTFPVLPPARGRAFAQSWWGLAWLRALEDGALDGAAVKSGRRLARAGAVGAVTVRPGRVTAVVRDARNTAHRADILVPQLSEEQWVRFLDLAVEQAGHLAALLDRELPPHLIEDAAVSGVDLLPGIGELEPECDCDAWDHCGHTAALCHQVARLLDEDPFALLLMRGRERGTFLRELHVRSTAPRKAPSATESETETGAETEADGVDAAEAWAAAGILPPLPALPPLPDTPGVPPSLDTGATPARGVDPAALEHLAGRTAVEAYRLVGQDPGAPSLAELPAAQDAVRLAGGAPPETVADRLAEGSGRGREGLAVAVRAWRVGGVTALALLDEQWQVTGDALARARAALEAAWEADERPPFRMHGNHWTVPGEPVQLRLGQDDRWWPYRYENGRWAPAGDPDRDPATALATARLVSEKEPGPDGM
ncbi:SWF or SNF family helicase [Streptomyces sp. NPDC047028]|uniref:SWIM zinc finger family protein n=1 Tax=Streptomyces sp. NPDC047028 TaxID=3155793 RepID=UPI0033ECC989